MIDRLCIDLIYNIIEYLPNHEIMEIIFINKEIYNTIDKRIINEYMSYREHPLVFNKNDIYCVKCNQV